MPQRTAQQTMTMSVSSDLPHPADHRKKLRLSHSSVRLGGVSAVVLRVREKPPHTFTAQSPALNGSHTFKVMQKQKTFAIAANKGKGSMLRKSPHDDCEKLLDTTSRFRHQATDRKKPRLKDDFTHYPLSLNLADKDASHRHAQPLGWMNHPSNRPIVTDRLRLLIDELYQEDPHAADQLSNARTRKEFLGLVYRLFNLSRALTCSHIASHDQTGLGDAIAHFMSRNLHRGPTLKTLAQVLGYSEKYCSELFRSTMGETFSCYLKRKRTERATALLRTTEKSVAEIADALGFSDQFTFSHFFKRSTGQSPCAFRTTQTGRRPFRTQFSPTQETHRFPLD